MRQNFQPTPEKWHEAKVKIQAMIKWNEGAVTNKKTLTKKLVFEAFDGVKNKK